MATLALLTAFAFLVTAGAAPALAQGDPHFSVRMAEQEVHGYDWEQGIPVTVEIDDPAIPGTVDWTDTKLALPPEWDPTMGFVQFQPIIDGFEIEPGFLVTMNQLAVTKTHTVTSLMVTDVNETDDIVSGTGDEGADLWVDIWDDTGVVASRNVAVVAGAWSADFSVGEIFDIAVGTRGEATESDGDNNTTQWSWRVPDPRISVEVPNQVWSHGDGWIAGRTVTLSVDTDDDPANGTLYQTTTEVQSWGPGPWDTGWNFDNLPFNIDPGHYVIADDGVEVTRVLHVVDLTITDIDPVANDITGTAPVGSSVHVHACDQSNTCEDIEVVADGGVWLADFTIDIAASFGGAAQIYDVDGDSTHRGWQLNDPYFGVDVANEEMWAVNWPAGETLTFQVFADDTASDLLWTDTMEVFGTPWQNTEAGYRFWGDFDVSGGQYFTVSDGPTTTDLVVSTISISEVNPDDNFYAGSVDPTVVADVEAEVCAWARMLADLNQGVELCDLPDAAGDWIIDFDGVGDIIPGDHLGVNQRDPDGDETSHSWGVPPWIYIELAEQDEAGVDLYPDRVWLEQWIGPVDIFIDNVEVMSDIVTSGEYIQVDLDVEIGQTVRVVDGHDDKSLLIEELAVDNVTPWDDPVQPSTAFGTAAVPDNTRQVQVTASADYGWWTERWVPVISEQFQADFANPGNGWRESEIGYFGEGGADDIYVGGEVRANLWDFDNDQVQAIWHSCNPRIIIVRNNDRIEAVCFPVGSELVVELDDPANGVGIDWESGAPVVVTRNPEKPWETLVVFELGEYTAPDAAVVTATASDDQGDPVVIVETEVIAFTIDVIDGDNDTITGTAPEGSEVLVQADGNWRYPVADATNTWLADFSEPGDKPGEENPVDLGPGSEGGATLVDAEGSATTIAWRISNAQFQVSPADGSIWANDFEPNGEITVTIGAAAFGPYALDEWGNFDGNNYGLTFEVPADSAVSITDGVTTKDHSVTVLAVTAVDPDTEKVFGVAAPGSSVDVWVHDSDTWRRVVAGLDRGDGLGEWFADFTAAGIDEPDERGTADLVPGSNGNSGQCDDDNDCTNAGWRVLNAQLQVSPAQDNISGNDFLPDTELTITVDHGDGAGPLVVPGSPYSTSASGDFGFGFDPAELDLVSGDVVAVGDGETTKTHTVTELAVTDVDLDSDTVSGVAAPGSSVDVWEHTEGNSLSVFACDNSVDHPCNGDALGTWHADFSGFFDLVPGTDGNSGQCDVDDDCTNAGWRVAAAQLSVDPHGDWIWGNEWQQNASVTITIGAFEATLPTDDDGNFGEGWDSEAIDIVAGMGIEVTDGVTTKTHVVTVLAIADADPEFDRVTGTATADASVDVWFHDGREGLQVAADSAGEWTADFFGTHDLRPGDSGAAAECDDDGDCTYADWWVFNPTFTVEAPFSVWSSSQDWALGDTITLTVADPGFPGPQTTTVIPNEDDPGNFGWSFQLDGVFEIQPGHVVTVTDGEHTKQLTVVDLVIDGIDGAGDTVSGWVFDEAGDPLVDVPVEVDIDNENGQGHRTAVTGPDGFWLADFAVPGQGEGEEGQPFDIIANTGMSAQVFDDDWDSTHRGDCFECDQGGYQIDPIAVEHGDVLISETDGTLWLYRPDTGELSAHQLPFGGVWDIQWVWEDTIFIANSGDGRLWALHLPSGELDPIEDGLFGFPIGVSLESSAVGWNPSAAWIADGHNGILRLDDFGVTQVVDIDGVDGVVVAPDGEVYFTDLGGALCVVDESEPGNYRVVAEVEGYGLNGLVMTPDGKVLATSMGAPALVTIDPADGSYTIEEYPELRTPEDSAVGRTGEIFVIDSGFVDDFGDDSGLYVRNDDGTLTQLISHHDYPEFGDTVDLVVVGPWVTATKEASHTEAFAPGELVTFDVTVYNQLGPFGRIRLDSLNDTMSGDLIALEGCLAQDLASGESYTCSYELFVAGDVTNTATAGWADEWGGLGESVDSASVSVVHPDISIDKTTADAFGNEGDGIGILAGQAVTWNYVVSNDGDVDVFDIVVEDDLLGEVCVIDHLTAGESTTCTAEGVAVHGPYGNVGTVAGEAIDADGDRKTLEAADGSSYFGLDPGYMTDSSLCRFGDQSDLVFTPDMKNWPGAYKLAASNPGQFYWNTFFVDDGSAETFGLEIPYPFVTQGAMPLHAYGGVYVDDGRCFAPVGEMASYPAGFALADYTDTNGDGDIGFGDVYVVEVTELAPFQYLTLHLDYGLKSTKGWTRGGDDAFNDPDVNPELTGVDILNGTDHWFVLLADAAPVDGGSVLVANVNTFKNVRGFGGTVLDGATLDPAPGATVELRGADGGLIEAMATDEDGWYLSGHRHQGKTAGYLLVLIGPLGEEIDTQLVTVGKAVKFGEANFLLPS